MGELPPEVIVVKAGPFSACSGSPSALPFPGLTLPPVEGFEAGAVEVEAVSVTIRLPPEGAVTPLELAS